MGKTQAPKYIMHVCERDKLYMVCRRVQGGGAWYTYKSIGEFEEESAAEFFITCLLSENKTDEMQRMFAAVDKERIRQSKKEL